MRIIKLFDFLKRNKAENNDNSNAWILGSSEEVTKKDLLGIPTVSGCAELISNTIASLPIQLFRFENNKVEEVDHDKRINFLNDNTGDTLNGFEFKKAIAKDYLLYGGGYAYINRKLNTVKSIHYVKNENVSVMSDFDPIFKHSTIQVNGATYEDYQFIKLLRSSKDGATGTGILEENFEALKIIYNSLKYENLLVSSGGNKKGFIKSQSRLSDEAIAMLKEQWNNMYSNNSSNCVVLNNGLDFQESANTSVEMQMAENKKINSLEVCKMFNLSEDILNGTFNDEEYQSFIKVCILPILAAFETSLNVALLNNNEIEKFYFKFDTKELMKADILKRYQAYSLAIKCGMLQIDEARYFEDMQPLGLDFIKLGLQDVLYNPVTKEIYTPNTNKTADVGDLKGGENVEN